jgi:hypothetical protein
MCATPPSGGILLERSVLLHGRLNFQSAVAVMPASFALNPDCQALRLVAD